jgi:hypothetical protein
MTPRNGQGKSGDIAQRVAEVRRARERLEQDVDVMTAEVRASVGQTVEKTAWKTLTMGAGILAGVLMRRLLVASWRKTRHVDPPSDPYQPASSWAEALTWAAATGVGVGVARVVAARGAAAGWERAMGAPPPGVSAPV